MLYPDELRAQVLQNKMVGVIGFEPTTTWSQTRCATKLRYTPIELVLTNPSSSFSRQALNHWSAYIRHLMRGCQPKAEISPSVFFQIVVAFNFNLSDSFCGLGRFGFCCGCFIWV